MAKWQEVAEGSFWQLADLRQYEPYFEEGERGLLELDLRLPVSEDVAQQLEDKLKEAGVAEVKVTTASPMLKIYFKKGFPWLAVIAAITIGLIVLAILIVGWRLFVEVPGAAPVFAIAGLGILALLVIIVTRKPPL
ncbi:hypothetical protein LCGC14_2738300 [marine sediment metagenome]|uniref:Uncharacterized protein n=1 Tax=marine sediment metagenome TaxID=412755 RepID=A0A0F9BE83_9ZZZZ